MNLETTHSFFNKLLSDHLCFGYQGSFNDEITNRVIDLSDDNINQRGELVSMKKKVSFLMAECFQNIVRHGDSASVKLQRTFGKGMFLTRNIEDAFVIASSNLIDKKHIKDLKEKLEKVNSLDKGELKSLYLEILENEKISQKGGAGLGLIEMARKSSQKLDFSFLDYDDKHAFFYLQINIKKNPEDEEVIVPISEAEEFHRSMYTDNILMLHKGNYTQDAILPILTMIENNMRSQSEQTIVKKRVYHVIVEILQNITLHSHRVEGIKQGIFMIGKQNGNYFITSGNYISNKSVEAFEKKLKRVSLLEKGELKELYIEKLKEERKENHHHSGLGIIDIARESADKIMYKFEQVDKEKTLFTIGVKI